MRRDNQPRSLQREAEPIEVDIRLLIIMSFIFFIALALIGFATRHYPSMSSII